MRPPAILNQLNPFNITYNTREASALGDCVLPSIEATTEFEVFFDHLQAVGTIAPCPIWIAGCECCSTQPLGPGSNFNLTPIPAAPFVAPLSECGTVNPAHVYRQDPNPNDVEENDTDESESSESSESSSSEELEEPPITGAESGVEYYDEDAGSVASGDEYFDTGEGSSSAAAKLSKPNEQVGAFSRHDHTTRAHHLPAPHVASPPHIVPPNANERVSDCLKCDEPNEWDNMILCENTKRHGENMGWFHYSCARLNPYKTLRDDIPWLCDECTAMENPADDPDEHIEPTDNEDETWGTYEGDNLFPRQGRKTRPKPGKHSIPRPFPRNDRPYEVTKKPRQGKDSTFKRKASSIATSFSKATKTGGRAKPIVWTDQERDAAIKLLGEIMKEKPEGYRTERRWQIVSDRLLQRYNIVRTWVMVKNFWNRQGRVRSGVDERNKPNKNRMVTGVQCQDPEARRQARKAKREAAMSNQKPESRGLKRKSRDDDEAEPSDDESVLGRRQRRRPAPAPEDDAASFNQEPESRGLKRKSRDDDEAEASDDEPIMIRRQRRRPALSPEDEADEEPTVGRRRKRRPVPAPAFESDPEDGTRGRKRKVRDIIENENPNDKPWFDHPWLKKRQREPTPDA